MKTIGLIGGMSRESTAEYYRIINRTVNRRLGRLHSAKILMYSFDFEELEPLLQESGWEAIAKKIAEAAQTQERAGAELLLLCTNTMHRVAEKIENSVGVPFPHIADATGDAVRSEVLRTPGLLGTRYPMEEDFCKKRLTEKYGPGILIPDEREREEINRIIFTELCLGNLTQPPKDFFLGVIENLVGRGAGGIFPAARKFRSSSDRKTAPFRYSTPLRSTPSGRSVRR